jgi:hypothetical protein
MQRHAHTIVSFIHSLRIFFLSFIIIAFLFELGVSPVDTAYFFGAKVGQAIGMSVGVPENPFNKLALDLKEKEDRLAARENALDERERQLSDTYLKRQERLLVGIAAGIVALLVLIIVNFYFDYRRRERPPGR